MTKPKAARPYPPAKPGRRRASESAATYAALEPHARIGRAIAVLGNALVAKILHVSPSQPGRWASGQERISSENLTKVLELDLVVGRLTMSLAEGQVMNWLEGVNPFLGIGHSRPIDVMILRGPLAILPAIDGMDAGAYA